MPTATSPFHLGQTVLLITARQKPTEVTITRIGRTNVAIEQYGRERVFNAQTGVDPRSRFGTPDHISTFEHHAEEHRRVVVAADLRTLIGHNGLGAYGPFTTDTLAAVAALLRADAS